MGNSPFLTADDLYIGIRDSQASLMGGLNIMGWLGSPQQWGPQSIPGRPRSASEGSESAGRSKSYGAVSPWQLLWVLTLFEFWHQECWLQSFKMIAIVFGLWSGKEQNASLAGWGGVGRKNEHEGVGRIWALTYRLYRRPNDQGELQRPWHSPSS